MAPPVPPTAGLPAGVEHRISVHRERAGLQPRSQDPMDVAPFRLVAQVGSGTLERPHATTVGVGGEYAEPSPAEQAGERGGSRSSPVHSSVSVNLAPKPKPRGTSHVKPKPTARPSHPARSTRPATHVVAGAASNYGLGYAGLLALPLPYGRGHHVRICGPAACIDRVSNDTGPVRRLHRVADLNVADFERVCGCGWRTGLVRVTVTYFD